MSLADFETHLNDAAPGFRCYDCGDCSETPTFLALVKHRVNPAADEAALSTIDKLLGAAGTTIKQFYVRHDGVLLYEDTLTTRWSGGEYAAAGVAFFPVSEWHDKSAEMRESLLDMGWSEDDVPDWLRHVIVFGEIPHSANYFVIQPSGEHAGKVFYADHDDYQEDPIASSFEEFIDSILADPADFLNCLGCYTRYSDGKTEIQWIPKQYVTGIGSSERADDAAAPLTSRTTA
jgi:hypothetical protein